MVWDGKFLGKFLKNSNFLYFRNAYHSTENSGVVGGGGGRGEGAFRWNENTLQGSARLEMFENSRIPCEVVFFTGHSGKSSENTIFQSPPEIYGNSNRNFRSKGKCF